MSVKANKSIRLALDRLPRQPGVYVFRGPNSDVLYVGKAKNLRSRVRSYFALARPLDPPKDLMVKKVARLETIITRSEIEALLLEANLIKKEQPPYNVLLKDDKSFLYVKVNLRETFPSVETTRRILKDGSRYFGPYTSAGAVYDTLKLLKKIFPYRTCGKPPDEPCFEFGLGRCAGHGDAAAQPRYRKIIDGFIRFLRGDTGGVLADLKRQMQTASRAQEFERAAGLRDRIAAVEKVVARQSVTSLRRESFDVVGLAPTPFELGSVFHHSSSSFHGEKNERGRRVSKGVGVASVAILVVREGKLLDQRAFLLTNAAGRTPADVLTSGLEQYYSQSTDHPNVILLPFPLPDASAIVSVTDATLTVPIRGRKHQLLIMAKTNAEHRLKSAKVSWEKEDVRAKRALADLAGRLGLPRSPRRIEAFDVSNVSGEHAVGSMVVFENGRPAKKWYRKFQIKTVRVANDPAMMVEVLRRRFGHAGQLTTNKLTSDKSRKSAVRSQESGVQVWPRPDLIILDGGIGQLNAVVRALPTNARAIPIAAIAKGGHAKPTEMADRERIFLPRRAAVKLPNPSDGLFLLERIRDEAHRSAIGFFRDRHRKATVGSRLDDVPGIGPATKRKLLRTFGSLAGIRRAERETIARVVGPQLADRLIEKI